MEWQSPAGGNPGYWHSTFVWTPPPTAAHQEEFVLTCRVKDPSGTAIATSQVGALGKVLTLADGKILLNHNHRITLIDSDGSAPTEITPPGMRCWFPQFTPDGARIYTAGSLDGQNGIFSLNPDGTDVRTVFTNADLPPGYWSSAGELALSPDGSKICLMVQKGGNLKDVFLLNSDGSNPVVIATDISDLNPGSSEMGVGWHGTTYDSNSLGDFLAVVGDDATNGILMIPFDGSGKIPIGTGFPHADFSLKTGKWAMEDATSRLKRYSFDGTSFIEEATLSQAQDWGGRWSPDGQQYIFVRGGSGDIHRVDADGNGAPVIYSQPGVWHLDWGAQ